MHSHMQAYTMQRLVLLLLLLSPSILCSPCDETSVVAGDTWINISWSLHCDMTSPDLVSYYHLALVDTTAGIYNQDTNQYCLEQECSFLFTLARPCIHYNISLQLIGLEEGVTYDYSGNSVTTEEEPVTAPRALSSTGTTEDSISLSWFPPATGQFCVVSYQVCATSTADPTAVTCDETTNTMNYTLTKVLPCTKYKVVVTPISRAGTGLSDSIIATTEDVDPAKPGEVTVSDFGNDFIELEWVKPGTNKQCVKGLGVFCEQSLAPTTTTTITTAGPTSSTPPLTGWNTRETSVSAVSSLDACRNYTCWVAYPDTKNDWVRSETISQSTWVKGVVISEPTNVTAMLGTRFMQVSWGAPMESSQCVDNYLLSWVDKEGSGEHNSTSVTADIFSYNIEDLHPCREYTVDIKTVSTSWGQDKTGQSFTSSWTTLVETPGPVTDLTVKDVTEDSFTVTWSRPGFEPQCVHHYDHGYEGPSGDGCTQPQVEEGDLQAYVGCLKCGSSYKFSVWAVDAEGHHGLPVELDNIQTLKCEY